MSEIGVVLVTEQRGVLTDIVRAVLEADPAVALREQVGSHDAAGAVERQDADAVVWVAAHAGTFTAPAELLSRHPRVRVIAVEGDGRHGYLWRMRPMREALGELSPDRLTAALHESS